MFHSGQGQKFGLKISVELLDYLVAARFEGEDAPDFLQAQLSADIGALEQGDAVFACYCSPKGQVYGLLLVCRLENGFQVIGSTELLPAMLDRLRMFVFRSKVKFAMEESSSVNGLLPSETRPAANAFQPAGLKVRYVVTDVSEEAGSAVGFKAFEISNQIAWLDKNTTEKFIPQMLGYEQIGAVSFTKGCYPGQEIVARARYLGKVKRQPVILTAELDNRISNGERVALERDETWVNGTVIDSARDADGMSYMFVVTSAGPEPPIRAFRHGEHTYRCATT
jgi:folate-binding protein YgfZ